MGRQPARRQASVRLLAIGIAALAACAGPDAGSESLDWTVGTWHGIRRDGADGTEAPMTLLVEALPGGHGVVERIQVEGGGTPYVGFGVRHFDPASRQWTQLYANASRPTFARLEGTVDGDRSTWNSVTAGPGRSSRLVAERLGADRWRRTQQVSEDGGRTWRVLFTDELERDRVP
jgi:hypothetical protein